jgi:Cu+-exporting ATPase
MTNSIQEFNEFNSADRPITPRGEREREKGGGGGNILQENKALQQGFTTCRLNVRGMTCTACSTSVESALQRIHGIKRAVVALTTEEAEVEYDPLLVNHNLIVEAVGDAGFEAEGIASILASNLTESISQVQLELQEQSGMRKIDSQEDLEAYIRSSLQALPGVKAVETEMRRRMVTVSYDPEQTGPRFLLEAIDKSTGLQARIHNADIRGGDRWKERKEFRTQLLCSCAFSVPIFFLSMVFMYIPAVDDMLQRPLINMLTVGMLLRWILATPVQFFSGMRFHLGAYNALKHGSSNMDVLVSLGTNAAYFYSVYTALRATSSKHFTGSDFFETGAMLISFILLGKYLEVLAKGKTCDAIAKLINLQPEFATLLIRDQDGGVLEREISTQLLHRRDTVKVIPSRKFPTDGIVVWGQSHVNESMITGEAIPVFKKIGDSITGGTLNESGALHVECTHVGQETTLAQIIRLVKTAQMAKAPVQKYADRISQYFVPFVSNLCLNVFFPCFACFCLNHVVLYCV